jgi:pilus assembly protein CpaE
MTLLYEEFRPHAEHFAEVLGGDVRIVGSLSELSEKLAGDQDELLVVFGPGTALAEATSFASDVRLARPHIGVVLLRPHVDISVMTEALRAGVREVVDANDPGNIRVACARSMDLSRQLRGPSGVTLADLDDDEIDAAGRVITVFAAKGGCGKTTMATNLAVALAETGRRVCIIDLDLAFGDVAIMLQLTPERTIADAIPVADRIDRTGLRLMLTHFREGVDALLAPVQPAVAEEIDRSLIAEVIRLARSIFDDVIVDTPPQFNDGVLTALDASHRYVLVTTPELPALKSLRVTLDMFDVLDYRRENRIVVLNRADSKVGLSSADLDRVIRAPIAAFVPSSRDVPLSINRGAPLMVENPGHPVSVAIRDLVKSRLAATEASVPAKGLRGMMTRRSKR